MFKPEKVERNDQGFWYHSAVLKSEEEDVTKMPEAKGMEFEYVAFEDDASEELRKMYKEGSGLHPRDGVRWEDAIRAWQPTPPEGERWFLLYIGDTDDGPYACFTRQRITLQRFWVCWWSSFGRTSPSPSTPYQYWINGRREADDKLSICAVIDAPDEASLWRGIKAHFPDCERRFCNEEQANWQPPSDKFPAFEGRTEIGMTATARVM
jgi:hypothetical protein